jgi:hypothetical protein
MIRPSLTELLEGAIAIQRQIIPEISNAFDRGRAEEVTKIIGRALSICNRIVPALQEDNCVIAQALAELPQAISDPALRTKIEDVLPRGVNDADENGLSTLEARSRELRGTLSELTGLLYRLSAASAGRRELQTALRDIFSGMTERELKLLPPA